MLQHAAPHYNTLQYISATWCHQLEHTACMHANGTYLTCERVISHVQTSHANEWYFTCETHCNTLQHTATHCTTMMRHMLCHITYSNKSCLICTWGPSQKWSLCVAHTNKSCHTLSVCSNSSSCSKTNWAFDLIWICAEKFVPSFLIWWISGRSHVCSVLQCVAVCCSVLQCVAVCCSVSQCVAAAGRMFSGNSHNVKSPFPFFLLCALS